MTRTGVPLTLRIATVLCSVLLALPAAFASPAGAHGGADDHPSNDGITVEIFDLDYNPDPAYAAPGDAVRWVNTGAEPHTVTADDRSFSLEFQPGESKSLSFPSAGTFSYFCQLHGAPGGNGMAGVLRVGVAAQPTAKLAGGDHVDAALAFSRFRFATGAQAPVALLGRSDVFADSLASGPAQAKLGAPLLLTPPSGLDDRVSGELNRLGTKTAYLLGGTTALSPAVEEALVARGIEPKRIAGGDRIETAIAVAREFFPDASTALVARAFADGDDPSRAFVDSLGAGAAAAKERIPVLFSETEALSPATKAHVEASSIRSLTLVGGEAALAARVEEELRALGAQVGRAAGAERTGTAAAIARRLVPLGQAPDRTVVIDGSRPDAWASGFPAAGLAAPVMLVLGDHVPAETVAFVIDLDRARTQIVCGPFVSETACTRVEVVASASDDVPQRAAFLSGTAVVPESGHPSATGRLGVFKTTEGSAFCFSAVTPGLDPGAVTAAHIHVGAPGASGPAVIALPWQRRTAGDVVGCVFGADGTRVAEIFAKPADHYLSLHTAEHPGGALRGQLFQPSGFVRAALIADAVVGEPANRSVAGAASGILTQNPDEICFSVLFSGPAGTEITAAHLHAGRGGTTGPAVLELAPPRPDGGPVKCYVASSTVINDLRTNPPSFYVELHSPGGAVRGQLAPAA